MKGVYFQAINNIGDPADITANLIALEKEVSKTDEIEEEKEEVIIQDIETKHEGRGKFEFVPSNKFYYLKITKPSGIKVKK
jgi:hypothetical protein